MIGPAERLAYTVSQAARVVWYSAQYRLARRLHGPLVPKARRPPGLELPGTRAIMTELARLLEQDLRNVAAGHYRMPHDLIRRPDRILADALRFFRDLPAVERRRRGGINAEVFHDPPPGADGLPRYYLQNFHYQTDGYLSEHSARLYDHQVEVLFSGAAGAMRRQALVPIGDYLHDHAVAGARLLDVAAGTGQLLTFIKDNWPGLDVTALDLSPYYLAEARRRLAPWARTSHVVQAAAEAIPAADARFDLVTSVFLFHELPRAVRARAAAEMARVLKPGGRLILIDSMQRGDRPAMDGLIDLFPLGFHEPYFADYARDDLDALFAAAGLRRCSSALAFMAKVLVLEKPAERVTPCRPLTVLPGVCNRIQEAGTTGSLSPQGIPPPHPPAVPLPR